ncbi:MAG: hypothetical protein ACN6OV_00040 [Acinetobacter sp.]|uniref:hypothetical protein n=1 Tax=Acinetobacter sp. TaxID=472 RepID=UPI003D0655AA
MESFFLKAVYEPAYRPEFLQQLMSANVYCVGSSDQDDQQDEITAHILDNGASIQLKKLGG